MVAKDRNGAISGSEVERQERVKLEVLPSPETFPEQIRIVTTMPTDAASDSLSYSL